MQFSIFKKYDLLATFSDRNDGNMSDRFGKESKLNCERFFKKSGVAMETSVRANLVHGDNIEIVDGKSGRNIECDAFVTNQKGISLWFATADCLPIFYFDPVKQVAALAHCGWQSTDKHLSEKVVNKLIAEFDSDPKNILIGFGPAIHKESYVFMEPETKNRKNWAPYLIDLPNGETMIDNIQYNIDQLLGAGIKSEHIEVLPIDTGREVNYFSHYRAKRSGEEEGRFCNIICLKS